MGSEVVAHFIASFPEDEKVLGMRMVQGHLFILTNKAVYQIPAKTVPFLGVHPILNWEPFRVGQEYWPPPTGSF
jgi:hypothetical protein